MNTPGDFLKGLLDETRDEINRADAKASILLGGAGISVGSLISAVAAADLHTARITTAVWILATISTMNLAASVVLLGAAILPRIGNETSGSARYFMDHAQYDDVEELRRAVELTFSDLEGRHLHQLRDLARIVKRKYRLSIAGECMAGLGLLGSALTAFTYFVSAS